MTVLCLFGISAGTNPTGNKQAPVGSIAMQSEEGGLARLQGFRLLVCCQLSATDTQLVACRGCTARIKLYSFSLAVWLCIFKGHHQAIAL